jgi:hypothetical protein
LGRRMPSMTGWDEQRMTYPTINWIDQISKIRMIRSKRVLVMLRAMFALDDNNWSIL